MFPGRWDLLIRRRPRSSRLPLDSGGKFALNVSLPAIGPVMLSIRQAIERVTAGQLRVPAFQRGFVWDTERVAYLMDSIYKDYPFGALILWRTKTQLRSERALGPFELPDRDPDYPIDYVLDGQQRLTSIFGVFQTDIYPVPGSDVSWTKIYYDFEAEKDLQESQFEALKPEEADPGRYFPVTTFFDPVAYRVATQHLSEDRIREIDSVQAIFKEASIPTQVIETDDRGKVAIVFERVNRLGVELDTFQLLSAWTWSEEFDLQEQITNLSDELAPFGFGEIGEQTNLLLRCCSAVIAEDVTAPGLLSLNGGEVRERFDEIANGLRGAIDFLRNNLHVEKLANLPYPAMLVPLTVFFAVRDGQEVRVADAVRGELVRWFWRSCFSRRFSSDVLRKLKRDLTEARKLRVTGNPAMADIDAVIHPDLFSESQFTIGSVNTSTFLLLLSQFQPRSFVSGSPANLREVLKTYNRTEFHHLYPRAYLAGLNVPSRQINCLANFAFVSASDNKILGGVAPSQYKGRMNHSNMNAILESAAVPLSLFDDDYNAFVRDRSKLLTDRARMLADL